ncbi:glycosyltransferase, partial [archaeon]|nr:glycosyltransferase [archaeon]
MRICMFTNTYLPHVGGVANSVAAFAEDIRQMGHKVLVVAPTFPNVDSDEEDTEEILRVPAIQNFSGSDFSVRIPIPFIIADKIDDFNPDLIHSHHPYIMGDAAMRTAFRLKLPLVFTHHTRYEEYTHYVPADSGAMKRFVINLSTEYANMCSQVIAPSESIAKLIVGRGVTSPVTVIPTGIDIGAFQSGNGSRFRQKKGIGKYVQVIGHVGENGRLLPQNAEIETFSGAIVDFFENDELRRQWQDRAPERAAFFSRERCSRNLAKLYESAITLECRVQNRCDIRTKDEDMWNKLLRRIRIEWEMLSEK